MAKSVFLPEPETDEEPAVKMKSKAANIMFTYNPRGKIREDNAYDC